VNDQTLRVNDQRLWARPEPLIAASAPAHSARSRLAHLADGVRLRRLPIAWQPKRGTSEWHVYAFIADKIVRVLKRKKKVTDPL